jgi:hypothetical protein
MILSLTQRASSEVTLPPFQESGIALNHAKKQFANAVKDAVKAGLMLPTSNDHVA